MAFDDDVLLIMIVISVIILVGVVIDSRIYLPNTAENAKQLCLDQDFDCAEDYRFNKTICNLRKLLVKEKESLKGENRHNTVYTAKKEVEK